MLANPQNLDIAALLHSPSMPRWIWQCGGVCGCLRGVEIGSACVRFFNFVTCNHIDIKLKLPACTLFQGKSKCNMIFGCLTTGASQEFLFVDLLDGACPILLHLRDRRQSLESELDRKTFRRFTSIHFRTRHRGVSISFAPTSCDPGCP